jgi:carbamoyltransferase
MNILGVNFNSHCSACLIVDNELIYFNQEERLSRLKNDSGIPYLCLEEIKKIETKIDLLLVTGYNYNINNGFYLLNFLNKSGFNIEEWYGYYKSHHLVHAAKAVNDSGFDDALVFVQDGKGSSYMLSNGYESVETTSIYEYSKDKGFCCVYKNLFSHYHTAKNLEIETDIFPIVDHEYEKAYAFPANGLYKDTKFNITNHFDLGLLYTITGQCCGFTDDGGKLMGLQSYGTIDSELPDVLFDDYKINMDVFTLDHFNIYNNEFNYEKYPYLATEQKKKNFAYKVQKSFEEKQHNLILKYLKETGKKNLVMSGGTALNVVGNGKLLSKLDSDINIFIEPVCGDEGNSIGICNLYLLEDNIKTSFNIYNCGTDPQYNYNLLDFESEKKVTDQDIAELIAKGAIVSYFHGKGEAGPRALGNRSLLFNPSIIDGKDIVNTVKGRESFRPFACSILEEHAKNWFDFKGQNSSPYMMFALECNKDIEKIIPSVIHVDGTCRVQTVNIEQNKNYYNLINEFYKITNIPLLFNTSFNLAGDPIVHTVQDALESIRNSKIEYLYLPEINTLIHSENLYEN